MKKIEKIILSVLLVCLTACSASNTSDESVQQETNEQTATPTQQAVNEELVDSVCSDGVMLTGISKSYQASEETLNNSEYGGYTVVTSLDNESYEYQYDDKGRVISYTTHHYSYYDLKDGSSDESDVYNDYEIIYNDDGTISVKGYNGYQIVDGNILSDNRAEVTVNDTFDSHFNCIKTVIDNVDFHDEFQYTYQYDDNGNVVDYIVDYKSGSNTNSYKYIYSYDEYGNLVSYQYYEPENDDWVLKETTDVEYSFDLDNFNLFYQDEDGYSDNIYYLKAKDKFSIAGKESSIDYLYYMDYDKKLLSKYAPIQEVFNDGYSETTINYTYQGCGVTFGN